MPRRRNNIQWHEKAFQRRILPADILIAIIPDLCAGPSINASCSNIFFQFSSGYLVCHKPPLKKEEEEKEAT